MIVYHFQQASIEHPERCEDAILVSPDSATPTPAVDSNTLPASNTATPDTTTDSSGDMPTVNSAATPITAIITTDPAADAHAPVFAVIDGMGGHQHQLADGRLLTGQDAAQLIRTTLIEDLEHFPPTCSADPDGPTERALLAAVSRAHEKVHNELNSGEGLPLHERIGAVATIVVVCETAKRLLVAQVGDSRAYLFTDGDLIQLCYDEDNIELLVRRHGLSQADAMRIADILNTYDGVHEPQVEGTITLGGQTYELYMAWRWFLVGNQALNIPAANVVINSLGTNSADPVAQKSRIEIGTGDRLLLCSDGVYKNLSEAEIVAGLQNPTDPARAIGEAAVARSEDKANHRRDPDDVSAIVVQF
ncbi:MAG: PP2C family protein-serine/threonine phosphatase [Aggregatilineales bacterium]